MGPGAPGPKQSSSIRFTARVLLRQSLAEHCLQLARTAHSQLPQEGYLEQRVELTIPHQVWTL